MRLTGMGPFIGLASVLFVLGVLAVLLEVQSSSFVLWSGIKVHGTTQNGLTYYDYAGQHYAIDNRKASAADSTLRPTTVWLSRSDPQDSTKAYVENPFNRWLDFGFVVVWFVLAAAVLTVGLLRRRFRRRWMVQHMGEFGSGISDEVVRRLLADRKRRPTAAPLTLDD